MSMAYYFRRCRNETIVGSLSLALMVPTLIFRAPYFVTSPDMYYVKAKVLQVLHGRLFADPITGYDTFHPPFYHLCLAFLGKLGFGLDSVLVMVTIINLILIPLLVYKVLEWAYDSTTALACSIILPFVIDFMGSGRILLATSFNFSISIFLAGLWLYLKPEKTIWQYFVVSLLWGAAFLVSPVFLFLIAACFLRELVNVRNYRAVMILAGGTCLMLIPFFIQTYVIYSQNLQGASAFAFWRGFPDLNWIKQLTIDYLSPRLGKVISLPVLVHVAFLSAFGAYAFKSKKIPWLIPYSFAAYLLTYYHFKPQYAIRIQLFLSIFMAAFVLDNIRKTHPLKSYWQLPLAAIALTGFYHFYSDALSEYRRWNAGEAVYQSVGNELWKNMGRYLVDDQYIFCTKDTYFRFVMTEIPVHCLGAYKTLDYYQVKPSIADALEADYQTVINSNSINVIAAIASKYRIESAVANPVDMKLPLFQTLAQSWKVVYRDKHFTIFQKPS